MNSHDDDNQNFIFGILFFVIALVLMLTVGMGIRTTHSHRAVASVPKPLTTDVVFSELALSGDALAKLYFNVGATQLSEDAKEGVARIVSALRAQTSTVALVSGFHDESGSAATNAEVSKQRALSVRAAIIAQGIPENRVLLSRPALTLGGGNAEEARRVEVRVLEP